MKLATLNDGSRDGQLLVVSRDLKYYISVKKIAPTLQFALDNWSKISSELKIIYEKINDTDIKKEVFDERLVHCPLPRSYQWADGSAYVNHVSLVRQARGAQMPKSFWTDPLMYQGGSDDFTPPRSPIILSNENWGIDMEAELAIITNNVPMGCNLKDTEEKILLLMLVNDVSLRNLVSKELEKGFGFFQSKPSTSFSPVAVTPDELGKDWKNGKLKKIMNVDLNDKPIGRANAGIDMTFNFNELIFHAAKSRNLRPGTIIGSGTISNRSKDGGPGLPIERGGKGYSCIAEIRMVEKIQYGKPKTPFMSFGDKVTIEMLDYNGKSIFGKIEQTLKKE